MAKNDSGLVMRAGGFTLLEVLIALTLFGLMLGLVFGTLQMAGRTFEAGEVRAEQIGGRMVLERFLRHVLGQARVWPGAGESGPMGLQGSASELSFFSYLPHAPGMPGLARFTLYSRGQDLRVRVATAEGIIPVGEEDARDQLLLEDVLAVRFAYWQEGNGGQGEWVDQWDGTVLPKAVLIEVARAGENWPPYIVPLELNALGVTGPVNAGVLH